MTTANIAEVLKLAVKPVQYDNDEKDLARVPFQARELPLLERRVSTCGEPSDGNGRIAAADHPNVESQHCTGRCWRH